MVMMIMEGWNLILGIVLMVRRGHTMNEIHDLVSALLAVAIAAVLLAAGGLYIDRPIQSPSGPAQMALVDDQQ